MDTTPITKAKVLSHPKNLIVIASLYWYPCKKEHYWLLCDVLSKDKKGFWEDVSEWYQEAEPPQGFQGTLSFCSPDVSASVAVKNLCSSASMKICCSIHLLGISSCNHPWHGFQCTGRDWNALHQALLPWHFHVLSTDWRCVCFWHQGEYLYIGAAIWIVVFCVIEMRKPDKPHNFEPEIYLMERSARDKLIADYNSMDIWDFNEKYGELWDFTVNTRDDIVKSA